MSQSTPIASSSSSNFHLAFNAALEAYEKATKNDLRTHPIATKLQSCNSTAAILSVLQDLVQQSEQARSRDENLRKWLEPTVNVLLAFSATLGEGFGLLFSPAKVIFTGIGILLSAAKEVNASQDIIITLLTRIGNFFMRLEAYTAVPPTLLMSDMVVKIMVEVLHILAIVTTEIRQGRRRKYLKQLLRKSSVEDALKTLDMLTQEEARMVIAEILKVTHMMDDKMRILIDAIARQTTSNVDEEKLKQLRWDLQRWLSPPDPSINHNIARSLHHASTASWFFESDEFKEWKSTAALLWIHGNPGSGKSILCSSIIEDIMALHDASLTSLAYFYCDFRDGEKRSLRTLILSILCQLATQSNLYCGVLSRLCSTHDNGARKPSDRALRRCLTEMLSLPGQGPIYLILDALDECPNNSGMPSAREEVLEFVKCLVRMDVRNLHICVTSRPEIDIQTTLDPLTTHQVSLHNQRGQRKDIVDYINSVVYSDMKMRRWREEDKRLVIETLSERADGMFRWVYCQLETLRHCLPPSIRGLLDELPETLDETYEGILRDIHKANREHARRLLQCLAAAVRPLRVEELAEVLAIDFDAVHRGMIPRLNPDWRSTDQHHIILSTCSSLIAVIDNGYSLLVQFSHFSVKEFLTSNRLARSSEDISRYHIVLEPAHTIFAQASLAVLLCLDDRVNGSNVREIPLAEYAARHWVDHARFGSAASHIQDAMEYFFDADKPHWAAWLRVHNIDEFWARFTPDYSTAAQPLYYAALCGFYNLAKKLITKYPEQVNTRGGEKVAPLVAALYGNHRQVSELLHQHGADIHVRGHWNRTLLHAAVLEGLLDVARWLLDHGADVDARQDGLWTPLHLATYRGCFEVAKVLVEHNADVNGSSESGEVPLHLAASPSKNHDQPRLMKLLLDYGADPNARDNEGSTPLHHSSYTRGQEPTLLIPERVECARLLLEHGANINAQNNKGQTPLRVALARGQHQVAEFLLGHDTN